jgi:hypothetical protein
MTRRPWAQWAARLATRQDRQDLKRKVDAAVEVWVKRVPIAFAVAQNQREQRVRSAGPACTPAPAGPARTGLGIVPAKLTGCSGRIGARPLQHAGGNHQRQRPPTGAVMARAAAPASADARSADAACAHVATANPGGGRNPRRGGRGDRDARPVGEPDGGRSCRLSQRGRLGSRTWSRAPSALCEQQTGRSGTGRGAGRSVTGGHAAVSAQPGRPRDPTG